MSEKNNTQDKLIIICENSGKDMDKIDFLKNIRQRILIYACVIDILKYVVETKGES